MVTISSASNAIWETFSNNVTRNASAAHNNEASGLGKVKAKVVPGKRVALSSWVNFHSERLYEATALAHNLIVSACDCLALTELTMLGEPKCLYAEKFVRDRSRAHINGSPCFEGKCKNGRLKCRIPCYLNNIQTCHKSTSRPSF